MIRNESIVSSKIVLFAGAGASQPFGKWLMDEFLDHLIETIRSPYVPPKGLHGLVEAIISYKGKDLENILKEINDLIEKAEYLGDTTKVNFIHDLLDQEAEVRKRMAVLPGSGSLPTFFPSTYSKNYSRLAGLCQELRSVIEKTIFDHYSVVDKEKVVELYDPLINILSKGVGEANTLPIFTTNYDICFEEYCKEKGLSLIDGFPLSPSTGRDYIWEDSNFDKFIPDKNKKHLILFKLHGSVTWYEERGMVKYLGASLHLNGKGSIKNTIIYPAKNKIALGDPFFTAYDYFQRCLDRASIALFIGYSFRDYDTVTKIKSALKHNPNLRILVLSVHASKVVDAIFPIFRDRIEAIPFKFGIPLHQNSYLNQIAEFITKCVG
jgi:hypothetical protein